MNHVAIELKALKDPELKQLEAAYHDVWNLEAIVAETSKMQFVAQRVSGNGRNSEQASLVTAMQTHQTESLKAAEALLQLAQKTMYGLVEAYLTKNGIVKGMMLVDDGNGQTFKFEKLGVSMDWAVGDALKLELSNAKKQARVCIYPDQDSEVVAPIAKA